MARRIRQTLVVSRVCEKNRVGTAEAGKEKESEGKKKGEENEDTWSTHRPRKRSRWQSAGA